MVGPALHFSVPSVGSVVDGRLITGPAPHVKVLPVLGEKKNDVRMSLTPDAAVPPTARGGCDTNGTITRAIRFNLGVSENGITGCTFRMKRVCLSGPTFCSQLNWKGTLTRSEMGFDSFLASSAPPPPAATAWPADDWATAAV